ncbi:MAG: S41 family peptidase [Anaerolineales bacterium]|nr:S41 family peptidase [Anaerolineales bacterium]
MTIVNRFEVDVFRWIIRIALMIVFVAIVVTSAYGGGYTVSRILFPPPLPPDGGAPEDWKSYTPVLFEAWGHVQRDFYKAPVDPDTLANGSVAGMVRALGDQHTAFIDAKRAAITRTDLEGSFEGIGATVEMREGRLTIVSPIKGSPAERAGLAPNDIIARVNETPIQNMDVSEAIALVRGPKGTEVVLTIQRGTAAPFQVTIVRDTIRTPFVESRMIEGTKIAYVRLNQFGGPATEELRAALRELLAQNPTGLVFDLRRDPGGYLGTAVEVASQFLPAGRVVLLQKDKNGNAQELKTRGGGLAANIPMVLLIDNGSASASEILAGALKDYQRATLIGVKTYGKGSVQNVHTLSDKSELRVTIARFFSPKGNEINTVGVTPDIEVKLTEEDAANKRDPQLDRAVQFLQTGK